MFPPRGQPRVIDNATIASQINFRKIPRNSPHQNTAKIDLAGWWAFIKPCVTTKTDVEKRLGKPIPGEPEESRLDLPTYSRKDEKIRVFYTAETTSGGVCGNLNPVGTVILFSVIPITDLRLSDLKINLAKFKDRTIRSAARKPTTTTTGL